MDAPHLSTISRQDYVTPATFISLCENRFGVTLIRDLAATPENTRCPLYYTKEHDALKQEWAAQFALDSRHSLLGEDVCYWLNPEYKSVTPWMAKCKEESERGAKIITLTLSSVGSNWFNDYVAPNTLYLHLRDRITFEGQTTPFAKDLTVALWGFGLVGSGTWDWKQRGIE